MDRRTNLAKSFVRRLPQTAVSALNGGARFVHPSTGVTQWHFGQLQNVDGIDVITVQNAGDASKLGDILVVIAISDDSDALLVRDDQQMTCMYWYHDGHTTEKLGASLGQWLNEARRVDIGGLGSDTTPIKVPQVLVGQWLPHQILTPGMKGHLKTVPKFEIHPEGTWTEEWSWPSKATVRRRIVQIDEAAQWLDVRDDDEILRYHFEFDSDNHLALTGPDPDYKISYQRAV